MTGESPSPCEYSPRQRRHRRVVRLSRVDEELRAEGVAVAWDAVRPVTTAQHGDEPLILDAREREMRANVPPHW